MKLPQSFVSGVFVGACLLMASVSIAQSTDARSKEALTLNFCSTDFVHRWSKDGQNELSLKRSTCQLSERFVKFAVLLRSVRSAQRSEPRENRASSRQDQK